MVQDCDMASTNAVLASFNDCDFVSFSIVFRSTLLVGYSAEETLEVYLVRIVQLRLVIPAWCFRHFIKALREHPRWDLNSRDSGGSVNKHGRYFTKQASVGNAISCAGYELAGSGMEQVRLEVTAMGGSLEMPKQNSLTKIEHDCGMRSALLFVQAKNQEWKLAGIRRMMQSNAKLEVSESSGGWGKKEDTSDEKRRKAYEG